MEEPMNRFSEPYPDVEGDNGLPEEVRNSLEKILAYSGLAPERARLFTAHLEVFKRLSDNPRADKEIRRLKGALATLFFEVYGMVARKVLEDKNPGRVYQMFLHYGFMDEGLAGVDNTLTLYEMVDQAPGEGKCSVYNGQTWLGKIISREKEPSVNDFGLDYQDVFREKKRRGEITDKDKAQYDEDLDGRIDHEIGGLFKMGQRMCCGRSSDYFPIFHRGMVTGDLSKSLVTPQRLEESLDRILQVDFSALHRETVYSNPEKGIRQELIMQAVWPDFILMPVFGAEGVMWQGLSGKLMNSPGRFLFPIFLSANLDDVMLETVAKFRWELSRALFAYTLSDSQEGALVGDYSSYIQFYKKNRDLSSDAKEKLKVQIEKKRNHTADVFASDYYAWVQYESKGLLRLNKVAREILFKHCPFSRPIRDSLEKQPLFSQFIRQFENIRARQARLLEARYAKLQRSGIELDKDLEENLRYYQS
jgi:hypothetical protein